MSRKFLANALILAGIAALLVAACVLRDKNIVYYEKESNKDYFIYTTESRIIDDLNSPEAKKILDHPFSYKRMEVDDSDPNYLKVRKKKLGY